MKSLIYREGEWRYLHCSMGGSYYIPCDIIELHEDGSKTIEYYDVFSKEHETEYIPVNEIEIEKDKIDDLYEQFLTVMIEDLVGEMNREGSGYTLDIAVENRLDILREDIKDRFKIKAR
jgi:hypothetical protein